MPPTPTRASGAARKTNMEAILQNILSLYAKEREGQLSSDSRVMLRKAIHENYRYIIAHAIHKDRPNPLLEMPETLNPSIAGEMKEVALVSPEDWNKMVLTADAEIRQKYSEGILDPMEYRGVDGSGKGASRPSTPVAAATMAGNLRQQQVKSSASGTGTITAASSAAPSPLSSAAPSPVAPTLAAPTTKVSTPTPIAPAPTPAPAPKPAASSSTRPSLAHPPPGIMSGIDLRKWASMSQAERNVVLERDPDMKQRFEVSLAYYRNSQAKVAAKAAANNANSSTPQPLSQAPAPVPTQGHSSSTNPNASGSTNTQQPTLPVLGNPNFTLSQPPPPRSTQNQAGPSSTSNASGEVSGTGMPKQISASSSSAQNPGTGPPIQPMSVSGVEQQFGGYVPPPRREESELDKRKRKYKEWIEEMGTGLEMEVGVSEMFNDVVDRFVSEVTRAGIRLSKHRSSTKVEVKDLALYLDQHYHMTVPGFDAIIPNRPHIPPDTEDRKRLRTVIPRMMRRTAGETGMGKGAAVAVGGGSGGQAEVVTQAAEGARVGVDGSGGPGI